MTAKKSRLAIVFVLILTMISFFSMPMSVFADDDSDMLILQTEGVMELCKPDKPTPPPVTYTVKYKDGDHGDFDTIEYKNLVLNSTTPAAPTSPKGENGYIFTGWQPTIASTVTEDVTYIAQWKEKEKEPKEYTVTYNMGGGDKATKYFEGVTVTVADYEGTPPADKVFIGWELNGHDTDLGQPHGTIFHFGDTFKMPSNNINFKATFGCKPNEPTLYSVTYSPGDHGTFTAATTSNLALGVSTPASPTITGETGYSFSGWLPTVTTTVTGTVNYVAQWTKDTIPPVTTYTVVYAPGTQGTFPITTISGLVYGAATPAAPTITGNIGYNFNGWSPTLSTTVIVNVTYTAQWVSIEQPRTYIVAYLPGDHGTFTATSTSGLVLGALTPAAPTVTGESNYSFIGWSPIVSTTITGSVDYVAQWEEVIVIHHHHTNTVVDEEIPGGPVDPPVVEPPVIDIPNTDIPAGPLPKTGGLDSLLLYGLGTLFASGGLGLKLKKK